MNTGRFVSRPWRIILLFFFSMLPASAEDLEVPAVSPAIRSRAQTSRDYAVVIGNQSYEELPQVPWAIADGEAMYDYLRHTRGVSRWRIRHVDDASFYTLRTNIRRGRWNSRTRGTLWIYFSGHGYVNDEGQRMLMGTNVDPANPADRSMTLEEVISLSSGSRSERVIIILDAGFGNIGRDGFELIPGNDIEVEEGFGELPDNVFVWAAERGGAPANSYDLANHGLHTYTVLGALRGWADGAIDGEPDGEIRIDEIQRFTSRTQRHLGRPTHPSIEERPELLEQVLVSGRYFERNPDPALFSLMAQSDLEHRIQRLQTQIKAEANALWQATIAAAEEDDTTTATALQQFLDEYETVTLQIDVAVHIPEAVEARSLLTRLGETNAGAIDEAAELARLSSCVNLVELEGAATLGSLNEGQIDCLEYRLVLESMQTTRNSISRVLIVNARSKGDEVTWERLVLRHLNEIDRSDPNLCFQYAVHLHRKNDIELADEAIHWADVALENKQVWPAGEYARNVYALFRLRTESANRLWTAAAHLHSEDPTRENEAIVDEYKSLVLSMSREWLDYARASNQDEEAARQICAAAAGTLEACR